MIPSGPLTALKAQTSAAQKPTPFPGPGLGWAWDSLQQRPREELRFLFEAFRDPRRRQQTSQPPAQLLSTQTAHRRSVASTLTTQRCHTDRHQSPIMTGTHKPMRLPPLKVLRVKNPNRQSEQPCMAIMSSVLGESIAFPSIQNGAVRIRPEDYSSLMSPLCSARLGTPC